MKQATPKNIDTVIEGHAANAKAPEVAAALKAVLAKLEEKQKLSQHRSRFLSTLEALAAFEEQLKATETFETNLCRVSFKAGQYSREDLFSISATPILLDCVEFLTARIKSRIVEIETELVK